MPIDYSITYETEMSKVIDSCTQTTTSVLDYNQCFAEGEEATKNVCLWFMIIYGAFNLWLIILCYNHW